MQAIFDHFIQTDVQISGLFLYSIYKNRVLHPLDLQIPAGYATLFYSSCNNLHV